MSTQNDLGRKSQARRGRVALKRAMRLSPARLSQIFLALATLDVLTLQAFPGKLLHATNGRLFPYRPQNFLSEIVRTQYGPWMTLAFLLLAGAALSLAVALKNRGLREKAFVGLAGIALLALAFFPTDLADLTTDKLTCGEPTRLEPCTLVGRIHNPLSTLVFAPILLCALSFLARARTESAWRPLARWAILCGVLAGLGILGATVYLKLAGWEGRWWTGLMQRSLVFPSLLWMASLAGSLREQRRDREADDQPDREPRDEVEAGAVDVLAHDPSVVDQL